MNKSSLKTHKGLTELNNEQGCQATPPVMLIELLRSINTF